MTGKKACTTCRGSGWHYDSRSNGLQTNDLKYSYSWRCPECESRVTSKGGYDLIGKCLSCGGATVHCSTDRKVYSMFCSNSSCRYQNSQCYFTHTCGRCEGKGRETGCGHYKKEAHLYCEHNMTGVKH